MGAQPLASGFFFSWIRSCFLASSNTEYGAYECRATVGRRMHELTKNNANVIQHFFMQIPVALSLNLERTTDSAQILVHVRGSHFILGEARYVRRAGIASAPLPTVTALLVATSTCLVNVNDATHE